MEDCFGRQLYLINQLKWNEEHQEPAVCEGKEMGLAAWLRKEQGFQNFWWDEDEEWEEPAVLLERKGSKNSVDEEMEVPAVVCVFVIKNSAFFI